MMTPEHPYTLAFEKELLRLGLASESELAKLGCMERGKRMKVLNYLAELAFACQNIANITLGRAGLVRVPHEVLAECWAEVTAPHLAADDEWEYRRIAELLELHAPALLPQHLHLCAGHANPDIREIATEGPKTQFLLPP